MNEKNEKILASFKNYMTSRAYSESSVGSYSSSLRSFFVYLDSVNVNSENFNNDNIDNFKSTLNCSKQTVNVKLFAILQYCDYLKEEKSISINYKIDYIKTPHKKSLSPVINYDEIVQNIKLNQPNNLLQLRDTLIFDFLYYLGIKVSDLVGIKKSDISEDRLIINNQKIVINEIVKNKLIPYFSETKLKDDEYLFFSYASQKINFSKGLTVKSIEDIFNKYTSFLDYKISITDLRNSYTHSNRNSLIEINSINSHSEITFYKHYLSLD